MKSWARISQADLRRETGRFPINLIGCSVFDESMKNLVIPKAACFWILGEEHMRPGNPTGVEWFNLNRKAFVFKTDYT